MAITLADFNKIWASTSPLTPYSFSNDNYNEGWNFIGQIPPSRQMWDFLQKNNDEKMKYLADNYLPLSGGTLTGEVNGVTPTAGDNSTKLATTAYVQEEIRTHDNMPIGFEYFSMNPNVPQGSLPLIGGEYSRSTYADLWAWVQTQTGYLKTEADWQTLSTANNGNVPYYSSGDGSTTFRVPSLKCWIKGANGTVSEVGSYLAAGLPNISGKFEIRQWGVGSAILSCTSPFVDTGFTGIAANQIASTGDAGTAQKIEFNASRSSSIYGNSTTVQPPSIVGMWLVKAYGTIVDTGTIDEQQYIDEKTNEIKSTYLPLFEGAGFHNSIYRGKYLGSSVTGEQYNNIDNGTFNDLFIGDYWVINGVNWRIAAFDYWLHCGDTECTTHHVLIVPDTNLATCKMNDTNITTGAYIGSDFYTGANSNTGRSSAQTAINNAFGSAHILNHRELLTNAVTNGASSGWAWYDSTFELMNESMVYGHDVFGPSGYETGIGKGQLPLFALEPSRITNRAVWWLRSVSSAAAFCFVPGDGNAYVGSASGSFGVRPAFAIKK